MSVSHDLIPIVLKHYNGPHDFINYITDLYSKLSGKKIVLLCPLGSKGDCFKAIRSVL